MSRLLFAIAKEEIMIPGGRYLDQAREVLSRHNEPARDRLIQAGALFWRAYASQDLWPREVREQAEPVIRQLLAIGRIDQTVAAMDEPVARRSCNDLVQFIRYCGRYDQRHAA